jgi:hypothetical protein
MQVLHELHHCIAASGAQSGRILSDSENIVDVVLQLLLERQLNRARMGPVRSDDHKRFH